MYIHDDADTDTVVSQTLGALKEIQRSIGKIGISPTPQQIEEIAAALKGVQDMLDFKAQK